MSNPVITNNDLGTPILESGEFRDDVIAFPGADIYVAGTILARDSVSKKLIAFVKGGVANEDGIAKTILTYDVEAAGAEDVPVRVPQNGSFRKEKLVIDADGDDTNIDADVIDGLRDYGLVPVDVKELNIQDNQ